MPVIFITYSLAYMDRANYGFASAAGIEKDLHITPGLSSLLGALFFLGYFFFQLPGAMYAERRSVKKLVFVSLIAWGILAAATGMVDNVGILLAIRFLLGVVEAAVMPAMLIFISNWYTRRERSRANTFLILGNPVTILWMSVVSGYLVDSLGWRTMFIAEGTPAVLWAVCWWFMVQDKPRESTWMSETDKQRLEDTLAAEQADLKPVRHYGEALRSRPVVVLSLLYFCWSIGVYGFVLWLPSILKSGAHLGMVATGWLCALPYFVAALAMVGLAWWSDHTQARLRFVWPALLIGAIAFAASYALGQEAYWVSYALLVVAGAAMYAPYGLFFAIVPEVLPKNVAGGAMALINGMGALGSFVGSYAVGYLNGATGTPTVSYAFMAGSLLVAVGLTFAVPGSPKPSGTESDDTASERTDSSNRRNRSDRIDSADDLPRPPGPTRPARATH
jgi:sugar phosphate permease